MNDSRFRPVVAVDIDGVLRVDPPARYEMPAPGLFARRITMRRDAYPTYLHGEPEWDEEDKWTSVHWFSGVGAEWIRDLLERGIDVVWATTWQQYANLYFAKRLGLPKLPVAVRGPGDVGERPSVWKSRMLSRQFDGRPLLWADDNPVSRQSMRLDRLRRRNDRIITHFHWVRNWDAGITAEDVTEMNEWLDLASTPAGHDELRRRRRRERDNARAKEIRSLWGTVENYRAWQPVRARLEDELGLHRSFVGVFGSVARAHPGDIDPAEIADLLDHWGNPRANPPVDAIVAILNQYQPAPRRPR
ncbi:hypothetical protein [Microbacterium terricola]|uniref:HAD family hydrolase n=1 Tax=Microbacterium terricola TaxID=344163 RepID=A0ABM8E371_9MICO|nr:hypothetical protein [Microbacterium terricola]UYK40057.1 hypothetical protein OAU46_15430 [Microbacterium terricola]BDV32246.1 hypothetical protein Microterr_29060 [Microbacterium terricola]